MQNGADIFTACALAGAALAFAFLLALFGIRCFAIVANALARLPRPRLAAFLFFAAVATSEPSSLHLLLVGLACVLLCRRPALRRNLYNPTAELAGHFR